MRLLDSTIIFLAALNYASAFVPKIQRNGLTSVRMAKAEDPDFLELQKKLAARSQTEKTATKVQDKKNVAKPVEKKATPVTNKPAPVTNKAAPAVTKAAPAAVKPVSVAKPVTRSEPVKATVVQPSSSSVSGPEVAAGVALGLSPYVILPAVLLSSVKGLIKAPKPLPVVEPPKPKVNPYSKPLGAGVKEGFDELLSGKSDPELDLTRKGLKLSAAGFAIGTACLALLSVTSPKPAEVPKKEVPAVKVAAPAAKAPAPAPVKAPEPVKVAAPAPAPVKAPEPVKVAAPAPAPAPVKAPEPVKVAAPAPAPVKAPEPVKVAAPAPAPVKAPEPVKVAAPAPAPVKAPEPVKVAAPAPAPVKAPEPVKVAAPVPAPVKAPEPVKVAAPTPAPVKAPEPVKVAAPAPAPVKAPESTTTSTDSQSFEEGAKIVIKAPAEGLKADTVDLDALKSLRKSRK